MREKEQKIPINRKEFYRSLTGLALPIMLQSLMLASVAAGDALMLGKIAQDEMTAVSLATQIQFIQNMFVMAITSAGAILGAQYWGKGDRRTLEDIFNMILRFSGIISVIFFLACELIPGPLMLIFADDASLIAIGSSYLRIAGWSYLLTGVSQCYLTMMKVSDHVKPGALISSCAVLLNIGLNAVFIFGLFGMPQLGAVGVAIATSLSRLVELAACFVVSFRSRDIKLDFRYLFVRHKVLFSDFVRLSLPALGNDISWSLAFSMYSVIIGHLGTDAVAANSFVIVVRNFGTILCFGMASAGGILLGKIIGENKLDEARDGAKKLVKLTVITGAIGGLMILAASPIVLSYARLTDQAMHYLKYMLLINTYYVMGAAVNTTLIAGVFRAGGDSRFGFICDTIDMWAYAVPLGFFAAFVLKLPVMWVYFLICTDEFVKWPWVIRHYRSGKWLQNITRDDLFIGE